VTAAAAEVPADLRQQLQVGAVMVVPIERDGAQRLVAIRRTEEGFEEQDLGGVIFVPLLDGLA
jgi:protein-L-isoaspartate(D-aspartate) O-methyltransferase